MRSLSIAGDYQILGRCADLESVQVFAARRTSDRRAEQLFALHHFPSVSPMVEQELRGLTERTRTLEDPILVGPRELVRTSDGLFVVTDFVAGETIEHIVKSNRATFTKLVTIAVVRDLVRAVERGRERTGRAIIGDVTSAQAVVSYETGELKLITIGLPLLRGRAATPATKALGLILWEMLVGRKPEREPVPPRSGADLDRITMRAIKGSPDDDLIGLAEELQAYLGSRTTGIDRAAELRKLIGQHFSHKATAMRALTTRWRSLAGASPVAPPRSPSFPPAPSRRRSSIRPIPISERPRPEMALAEPLDQIVILPPEELLPTDDLSNGGLSAPKKPWRKTRLLLLMTLLALALASATLVVLNGDLGALIRAWVAVLQ